MNDLPRHTLSRIIIKHGPGICDTPKRLEALLRDLCGAHRREINIIMGALEERVATDLTTEGNSAVPRDVLFARLAARLRDNLAYTPEAARWGVETWAVALGILSEAELQERARTQSPEESRNNVPPPVREPKSSGANPASANSQTPHPQRGSTYTPPPQPAYPPHTSSPPSVRPTATRRRPRPPSNIIVPEPPQYDISPPFPIQQRSRRGLTLRGCVISVVLIIVLIVAAVFVVPAILMILREEQAQPSINDPRIR